MGNNNLCKVENTLRSIAKRYKSVKYSLGLAILFLMMGVSAFSEEIVAQEAATKQEVMSNEQIATSKDNLKGSIGNLHSKIETARAENAKSLEGLKLELIQLMEQGDQVVKSPWSSWQFGAGYIYNNWQSSYKGRGDKSEKYPFEGVFSRETNEYNRYVNESSPMYAYLPKSNNLTSASSNLRGNRTGYGLASNITVPENPIAFQISASIKPRIVTKGAITISTPAALSPTLPKAIDFRPVTPKVAAPVAPTISLSTPPSILFNGQGFGQPPGAAIYQSNIIMQNWDTYTPSAAINITIDAASTTWAGGNINVKSGGTTNVLTPGTASTPLNAFISHVDDRDVDVKGTYNVTSNKPNFPLFISLNPYEYGDITATDKKFKLSGTLNMKTAGAGTIVGIEHQLLAGHGGGTQPIANVNSGKTTSILENSGNINMLEGKNMIGIMIDTEYFSDNYNSYFKKKPETINSGKITIAKDASESIGIDFGYFHYHPTSSDVNLKGPNTNIKVGNIIINGKKSYAYRQKDYTTTAANGHGNSPQYYDAMGTVDGSNGIITLNGENNVGYSIAQGKSTGDPISNFKKMQVQVNGKNNVGFLRNSDTATTNTGAITLDLSLIHISEPTRPY